MNLHLENRVVVVTGAGAGIGRECALSFAKEGAVVIVNSLRKESSGKVVSEIRNGGGRAYSLPGDVSLPDTAESLFSFCSSEFGRIDVLVNNAGIVIPGTIESQSVKDFDRTWEVNVRSIFLLSRKALPLLINSSAPSIINIASIAGLKGTRNRIAYSMSKGAVISLSRSMALELAEKGIRVNCVCPGMTYSPSLEERINATDNPDLTLENFIRAVPVGRLGDVRDTALSVLFLASENSSFTTGAVLTVDGGKSL